MSRTSTADGELDRDARCASATTASGRRRLLLSAVATPFAIAACSSVPPPAARIAGLRRVGVIAAIADSVAVSGYAAQLEASTSFDSRDWGLDRVVGDVAAALIRGRDPAVSVTYLGSGAPSFYAPDYGTPSAEEMRRHLLEIDAAAQFDAMIVVRKSLGVLPANRSSRAIGLGLERSGGMFGAPARVGIHAHLGVTLFHGPGLVDVSYIHSPWVRMPLTQDEMDARGIGLSVERERMQSPSALASLRYELGELVRISVVSAMLRLGFRGRPIDPRRAPEIEVDGGSWRGVEAGTA